MNNWRIRLAGVILGGTALWYGPWMFLHVNRGALWLAIPFLAANTLVLVNILVTCVNNWQRTVPPARLVPLGEEPDVIVIIPTAGEPVKMVHRTVVSVVTQNWPQERLRIIVSDDAHSLAVKLMVDMLRRNHPDPLFLYHRPPKRGSADRRGDAKAGNLNSALEVARRFWPDVAFIETRDADDEVGDPNFLRHCVGQMQANANVAFVQTIKEARVSAGDPFANMETFFYRGTMLGRNAANAVFPCGSGLLWRTEALLDITGFPTWNLVEDLQSGFEALRLGWRGLYVPIVGAVGQHAPEDIPNVYKQRGTWALDTMRLLIWRRKPGLNLRQRLHFLELGMFYLQGVGFLLIVLTLATGYLTDTYPLATDQLSYVAHFWPFALAIELFLAALGWGEPYETLLTARQMWMGLAPVYARASLLALLNGRSRKPVYRVTRKVSAFGWYWRETLPQTLLIVFVFGALAYRLATSSFLRDFDIGSAFWVVFYTIILMGFVRKSWFGVDWRRALLRWRVSPARAARAARAAASRNA